MTARALLALAAACAAAASLAAQAAPAAPAPPPPTALPREFAYTAQGAFEDTRESDDYRENHFFGGFVFRVPALQLEVRGQNALLLSDLEAARALFERRDTQGPPRRALPPPDPRRRVTAEEMRQRLHGTLSAIGGGPELRLEDDDLFELVRYFYCEGGVIVVREGLEVIRCERLWVSPIDDRLVVEDAELRFVDVHDAAAPMLIVRGPRLVKQGSRWTGRDLTLTTCTAGEPHAALAVGEAEIIEREGEFEVIARGQRLQIGGTTVLPLPDAHLFTGSQTMFPIRRASAGYSRSEGARAEVVFGMPWNEVGGGLHHWLLGRPAHEFRGEWDLGVGVIQERGVPLSGELRYGAEGLYEGRTNAFWLDDAGRDIREIQVDADGNRITNEHRGIVATQNRVRLGPRTHVDLQAFSATDEAVYAEFRRRDYRTDEVPETAVYVHHAHENHLFTAGGRWNLDPFSYRDDRSLAVRFTEELPVVTYHLVAEPLAETPWGSPVLVDLATELSQRRSDFDDHLGDLRVSDRTFRADQSVELSAPFHLGVLQLRPFVTGRGTWYDEAADGESEGRAAFEAGVQIGTRLSRTWTWLEDGATRGLRHVMAPRLSFFDRFRVDDDPSELRQFAETDRLQPDTPAWFDTTDLLRERALVRFELRNLLQRMEPEGDEGTPVPRDFVYFDLAQDWWVDAEEQRGGFPVSAANVDEPDELGLFYYDLVLRPRARWLPFETFAFALYGDHDWEDGMRTLNSELRFGPVAGITWTATYAEDYLVEGAVGLMASTRWFDRWDLFAATLRDLDNQEWLSWSGGLRRNDHDWSILVSAVYDMYTEESHLRVDFEPHFPGMRRPRRDRFGGSDVFDRFAAGY